MNDKYSKVNWHCLSAEEVYKKLSSGSNGLTEDDARQRFLKFGANELPDKKKLPTWKLFLRQFQDFMILILVAAAVVSGIISDLTDTIVIVIIVLLNAIIGFVQEYKAGKAMEALKKLAAVHSNVIRNGNVFRIMARELVPGDIILVEAGDSIPADARLTEVYSLRMDEAALTGESVPPDKATGTLSEPDLPPGDRLNMIYKGTTVVNGRGRAIVTATGMDTEIGSIARLLQQDENDTPLKLRLRDFGKKLSYIILFICILIFGIGLLKGEEPLRMLLISISLAVAAIPEALPALITIALARGARRMVRKNALVRKLPAVETLGSVTVICSDKTGTLTMNKMQVVNFMEPDHAMIIQNNYSPGYLGMMLNHDLKFSGPEEIKGDPTELALYNFGIRHKNHSNELHVTKIFPRVAEIPFDADRKCMTTIHRLDERFLIITKGASEKISELLLDKADSIKLLQRADDWSKEGLRVLAYAFKVSDHLPDEITPDSIELAMKFGGMAGLMDPIREEVKEAISDCRTAGIIPVMITGDHPSTAAAIARQLDFPAGDDSVISGMQMKAMSRQKLLDKVDRIRVYARVTPEQKLDIVKALQQKNHFVAMTGDGVNDAPSLKAADIGIAMGITGTDVSKEASHIILLDDNFATIVKAIREGRRIYDNIRKFIKYIMTCNSAEIWTIFMASLIGLPIPLLPIHILYINLVTDGLPGLALAGEKAEHDIMKRPPRKTNENLFSGGMGFHILWVGVLMAGITLATQAFALVNNMHWQTMVFTVLSLSQLGHVLAIRSEKEFLYAKGIFSNARLLVTVVATFLLQLVIIYLPEANTVFKTEPLSFYELGFCILMSAIVFHAVEFEKWLKKIKTEA